MRFDHRRRHLEGNQHPRPEVPPPADLAPAHRRTLARSPGRSLFRFTGRPIGMRIELQTFSVAEVIGAAGERFPTAVLPAGPLRAAPARICDDEPRRATKAPRLAPTGAAS